MARSARLQYLDALGIDSFVPRFAAPAAAATAAAPARVSPQPEGKGVSADWQPLQEEVSVCVKCALSKTRTRTVFGVGNPQSDWLVIGEAPGAEEDRQGEPFVGAAGKLLDAMLQAIGLSRAENAFIANMLKCRPPGNRDPKPEEVTACMPYLLRQITSIRPKLILAVGRVAAQNLLATKASLASLRGRVHQFGPFATPLIVTYHPAYLLREPGEKRKAWDDLKYARDYFKQHFAVES